MYVCMYVTNEWIFRQWDGCNRGSWVQMTTRSTRLCRQRERKRERERARALPPSRFRSNNSNTRDNPYTAKHNDDIKCSLTS